MTKTAFTYILPNMPTIELIQGDITTLAVDAIVAVAVEQALIK